MDDIILSPMVGKDAYYFCSLNFASVWMLGDFMILSALLGYYEHFTHWLDDALNVILK